VQINLPGDQEYKLEIIDTWNMKILEQTTVEPGNFEYKTTFPYCALKINQNHE
jgi:hypothetical protein